MGDDGGDVEGNDGAPFARPYLAEFRQKEPHVHGFVESRSVFRLLMKKVQIATINDRSMDVVIELYGIMEFELISGEDSYTVQDFFKCVEDHDLRVVEVPLCLCSNNPL